MVANSKPNEIQITRVYDAPVELVWDAWTDPDQTAQWWGPRGFTLTTHSKDLRPGGIWNYTMHGPDGVDYPNHTVYHEVEECKKLVYDHGGYDDRPPLFRVTVLFSAADDNKTTMEMTMSLPTAEEAEETRKFIKKAGGNATWDRLAEYLAKETADMECFVIHRSFQAPSELVFEMWTNADHFSKWLPPTGFEMEFLRTDIRPGGSTLFLMTNHAGVNMHVRTEYKKLDKPGRLVYTQQFCDESENLSRHPLMPIFPATLLMTVELAAEGPDWTRVALRCEPVGEVTPEELQAFLDARAGMTQGWSSSFDKLEAMLAEN